MAKARKKSKQARPLLAAAIFCEKILDEKDNVQSVIRVVDILNVPKPPEAEDKDKFAVAIGAFLAFKSGDAKGEYPLRLTMVFPSGKRVKRFEQPITFLGEELGATIRLTIATPVEEEGLYWYEVRLGGRLVTRMPLRIVHVSPKPDEESPEPDQASKGRS